MDLGAIADKLFNRREISSAEVKNRLPASFQLDPERTTRLRRSKLPSADIFGAESAKPLVGADESVVKFVGEPQDLPALVNGLQKNPLVLIDRTTGNYKTMLTGELVPMARSGLHIIVDFPREYMDEGQLLKDGTREEVVGILPADEMGNYTVLTLRPPVTRVRLSREFNQPKSSVAGQFNGALKTLKEERRSQPLVDAISQGGIPFIDSQQREGDWAFWAGVTGRIPRNIVPISTDQVNEYHRKADGLKQLFGAVVVPTKAVQG